jgi:chloramphenicol 3-O phosphotransferase
MKNTGFCCIINGPCSAGKSSLCQQLQNLLPDPNLHLGIDTFHLAIPPRALNLDLPIEQYLKPEVEYVNSMRHTTIKHGPYIKRINEARFAAVCEFVKRGIIVVSDELLWTESDVKQLTNGLREIPVYLIGLSIDEAEGSRREARRFAPQAPEDLTQGFRPEGMSRASNACVHQHMQYDLLLDSTTTSAQANAKKVQHFIETTTNPSAFLSLKEQYSLHK